MGIVTNNLQKLKRKWFSLSFYYLLYFIVLWHRKYHSSKNNSSQINFRAI